VRENKVRTTWQQGNAVVNTWLMAPSSLTAEVMAHAGWDCLTIDLQHGLIDYQVALSMMQAISTTDVTPFVRVPSLEPGIIGKLLDAGAYGLICPMINSREDAEALVRACRYAPVGTRSVGPVRAAMYGGPDYLQHAEETIVIFAMVETTEALANLEEIVSTPGVDGIYIGPGDLSMSFGHMPVLSQIAPDVNEAIATILASAKAAGKRVGIHCFDGSQARERIVQGFDFVSASADLQMLAAAAAGEINKARG
jgi:4-hydroxy-2-oxoheptanedioate aldolase